VFVALLDVIDDGFQYDCIPWAREVYYLRIQRWSLGVNINLDLPEKWAKRLIFCIERRVMCAPLKSINY